MTQAELKSRTKTFAVRVVNFIDTLPNNRKGWTMGDQLITSGTSVAVNDRAACRSKTKPTFIHKIGIVEEEADESAFWLEVLTECKLGDEKEATELTAIFTAPSKSISEKK
jgi:four helix bundle protein